ncbi:MAG TPA: right-handed parallel beta-helix repeat-containing protein [Phycisphaerae bacterium]|nr:right-handed parallel beta-helix repeat-containing protein [Phycisphaerae bacterium]
MRARQALASRIKANFQVTIRIIVMGVCFGICNQALAIDCNSNGIADELDIIGATSFDCDESGIPDECEFAMAHGFELYSDGITGGNNFGHSVAVDGATTVVGAWTSSGPGGFEQGASYVFEQVNGMWQESDMLVAAEGDSGDQFGNSVGVDGGTIVVGEYLDNDGGLNSGACCVFRRSESGWAQVATLKGADSVAWDLFGWSVAVSGDTAIVGARDADGGGLESGAVYVFSDVGGVWLEEDKLLSSDIAPSDKFGWSVAINGDTVVIGAPLDDDAGSQSGSAYVFRKDEGTWTQVAKLTAGDAAGGDRFGQAVAIDGAVVVVGAYLDDHFGSNSGAAYVFQETGGNWLQVKKLVGANGMEGDWFGHSVSISGDTIVVGAPLNDGAGVNSGSAYVFREFNGQWQQAIELKATDAGVGDNFARAVAVSGGAAIVGAELHDDNGIESGASYLFALDRLDCNRNGYPDTCDINEGTSQDCNQNLIPDECEIAGGTSADCDFDEVLDECEGVLFVDDSATNGLNDGSSWGNAFVYLQDALSAADANCTISEIWVAAGTYKPDQGGGQTPGDRSATFQLRNGLAIYGGFAGGESDLHQRDHVANVTVLEGDLNEDDEYIPCTPGSSDCSASGGICAGEFCVLEDNTVDNSSRLLTGSFTDQTALLDGFVVQGGQDASVCGIYTYSGSPTVKNCTFAGRLGARMYNELSNPAVLNCVFSNGRKGIGDGIRNESSSPKVVDCLFVDNRGEGISNQDGSNPEVIGCTFRDNNGVGMRNSNNCNPTVVNCKFIRNYGVLGGGMLNWQDSSPTITNCAFIENYANKGGAIDNHYGSNPVLTNCTFIGNESFEGGAIFNDVSIPEIINCTFYRNKSTNSDGGALRNDNSSDAVLTNCIVWGNTPDQIASDSSTPVVNHSIVQGGWAGAGGVGNLDVDPMFADTNGPDNIPGTEDDDLRLQPGSPAIDAGDSAVVPVGIVADLGEADRFVDDINTPDTGVGPVPIVDMGAYEFQAKTVLYVDDDAIAGANDGSSWADAYVYLQDALLDASTNGVTSQIWVAAGTYRPDQGGGHTPGDRSATFQLQSGLAIYGGFVGNESHLSQRDHESNVTILSGDLFGDDLPDFGNDGENSLHVVTGSRTDATAMLCGFVVTAGNANSPSNYYGGGMYNESGSPTLEHCRFQHNFADGESNSIFYFGGGAGMANDGSSPRVISCAFVENASRGRGPGMCNFNQSSPLIENCEFRGNQLFSDVTSNPFGGAGIHNDGSNPSVTNCVFIDNRGGEAGGMCNNQGSGPTVTNCVFTGNRPGGLANRSNSNPIILNCRFVANVGGGSLAAGVSNSTSHPSVINCSFFGSSFAGMSNTSSDPTVANCVFAGNGTASLGGGGMFNLESSPTVTSCTFSENIIGGFGVSGGGMLNLSGSNPTITNCVMWCSAFDQVGSLNSNPVVNHCVIQGGWDGAGGVGIIDAKPMFVNSSGLDNVIGTEDDDLRLLPNSPAIDAGDNSAVPVDVLTDLDGHARFVDDVSTADTGVGVAPIVDIGAYEFVLGDCDADGDADLDDHLILDGCLTSPGASLGVGCACLDLDSDGDVDLRDFALFQRGFFN